MKQYILLCRPRFEVAMIELDDDNDRRARSRALELAPSDDDWALLPFDGAHYQPHIQRQLSETDVEFAVDDGETREAALAEARELKDQYTRYMLLMGDVFAGEAEIVPQPWLADCNPLLELDLLGDWKEALEAYEENAIKAAQLGRASSHDRAAGQVLPFARLLGEEDEG